MKRHQPALLGGLFIGVLSSLPVVNWANCCCLWVIAGGMLVVYLQQQQRGPEPVETSEAVVGGLLAGVIGAAIYAVSLMAFLGVGGPAMQDAVRQAFEQNPQVPPEVVDTVMNLLSGPRAALLMVAIWLPLYAIFAMLGALLGLPLFRKKAPAPPPPPAPPAL